jgi:putative membrane protein
MNMKLLARIAVTALALVLISTLVPGVVITGLTPALVAAVVLGLLNALVRPILIILTLPITVLTLGLFIIVINASLFYLAASFVTDFYVANFMSAVLGSLIVTLVSVLANRFL